MVSPSRTATTGSVKAAKVGDNGPRTAMPRERRSAPIPILVHSHSMLSARASPCLDRASGPFPSCASSRGRPCFGPCRDPRLYHHRHHLYHAPDDGLSFPPSLSPSRPCVGPFSVHVPLCFGAVDPCHARRSFRGLGRRVSFHLGISVEQGQERVQLRELV